MLALYLACLVAGLGVIVVQLAAGHDAAGGGHDAPHAGDHDAAWTVLLSVRFWSFALVAFGLVGALLALIGTLGGTAILVVALGAGAASGVFAVTVVRRLLYRSPSSGSTYAELVGKVGRVIVPIDGAPGKVRVALRGAWVDVVARANETIDAGETVIVLEVDGDAAVVSKAPRELTA